MSKRVLTCVIIYLLLLLQCDNNNPATEPTFAEKIIGSWMLVSIDEFSVYDYNGWKDTTNETYPITMNSEDIDFFTFTSQYATYYSKDSTGVFTKTDLIDYTISGDQITGYFWKGLEITQPSDTATWNSAISFSGNEWIYDYVETYISHEGGYTYSREAYTMHYVPLPDSINLDSLSMDGQVRDFSSGMRNRKGKMKIAIIN